MASDGSEVDSLICDGPIRQGGRFRDQSQNRLAVGSGWFHAANVVQRRGQDSVRRKSGIFAGPDVGLVFEDFDGRFIAYGSVRRACSDYCAFHASRSACGCTSTKDNE